MTHLTDAELVDLLDGTLGTGRMRHVETCATCRAQAETLGAALRSARADEVPEPSPLFWEHLSTRVSEAVRAEPPPSRWTRLFTPAPWRLAAAAIAVLLVAGAAWLLFSTRERAAVVPATTIAEQPAEPPAGAEAFDVDAWDAIEAVAADLEWEDAQAIGIGAGPGSAERLVGDLTAAERSELARLIEEEMKRHGA